MIIVDIDGTLCECPPNVNCLGATHSKDDILRIMDPVRIACLKPRLNIIELVRQRHNQKHIVAIISGRWDYLISVTKSWLVAHGVPFHVLMLRKSDNYQLPSVQVKMAAYRDVVKNFGHLEFETNNKYWIDDDKEMIEAAEKEGMKGVLV